MLAILSVLTRSFPVRAVGSTTRAGWPENRCDAVAKPVLRRGGMARRLSMVMGLGCLQVAAFFALTAAQAIAVGANDTSPSKASTISATTAPSGSSEAVASRVQLIMLEEEGCPWCVRWHEEIGGIYHKTSEGGRAPLRRVDMHAPLPDDLSFLRRAHFSPTFVLVEGDREVGRIRGYPGADFFWPLLGELLGKLKASSADDTPVVVN